MVMHSSQVNSGRTYRPKIFIDGGTHGREWIAPAVVLHFLYQVGIVREDNFHLRIFDLIWFDMGIVNKTIGPLYIKVHENRDSNGTRCPKPSLVDSPGQNSKFRLVH